jgi:HSP20 family protein
MAEASTKHSAKNEANKPAAGLPGAHRELSPFERLRSEIDRLFEDFGMGLWRSPFRRGLFDIEPYWRGEINWGKVPAVDVVENANGYEITAELPGVDEKNVEVKYADGTLTVKGERKDEKEEKKENYYLSERSYGSFQRSFRVPAGVDPDKVEASFKNDVLTVTLPKTVEAQKKEKRIEIKQG